MASATITRTELTEKQKNTRLAVEKWTLLGKVRGSPVKQGIHKGDVKKGSEGGKEGTNDLPITIKALKRSLEGEGGKKGAGPQREL